jgi:hypothetical protein
MRKLLLLAALTAVAGCQTGAKLTKCQGSAYGLNAAHWRPSGYDLKACSQTIYGEAVRP